MIRLQIHRTCALWVVLEWRLDKEKLGMDQL